MSLNVHKNIKEKLNNFISVSKIPNIIFHGPSGSGKRTIVNEFIQNIYKDRLAIKKHVLSVNCAHGKGIKFIREDLKFFAKCHIHSNNGNLFKSIILSNADKLTIDAQSALRRCIELFSHTTRFFIIIENKYNLLKPILSRFCEIYVPQPIVENKVINLHNQNIHDTYNDILINDKRLVWLKNKLITLSKKSKHITVNELMILSMNIYESGYSCLDILTLLEDNTFLKSDITLSKRYELLIHFNKIKKEFRNEQLLILFILNFVFLCSELKLENISFM
jgi:DNA polymerase III delta prime subunit